MKISIGGMIGAGKSTLAENLSSELGLPVLREFEDSDEVFNTLLDWQYKKIDNTSLLLQIYFIHNLFTRSNNFNQDSYIVDRDLIEHWIFAMTNLKDDKMATNSYNTIFMNYMNETELPDLYIILDISWETFLDRIHKRGRKVEIDNLEINLDYFKELHSSYTSKLEAQCILYNINYVIIDANNLNEVELVHEIINKVPELKTL